MFRIKHDVIIGLVLLKNLLLRAFVVIYDHIKLIFFPFFPESHVHL